VGVAHGIDGTVERGDAVVVAAAVGDPGHVAAVPFGGHDTFEVAAGAVHEGRRIELGAARVERRDASGVAAGAHLGEVGGKRQRCPGDGIDHAQAVAGAGRAVEPGELPTDGNLRTVRRQCQRADDATHGLGRPVEQRPVSGAERGELCAGASADSAEVASDVHRGVRHGERVRVVGDRRGERGHELARGQREGGDTRPRLAVDSGEVAGDVEAGAVRRGGDRADLRVHAGGEACDQCAGGDVVGQQVCPGHRLLAGRGPCGTGGGEVATHIDRGAHDGLRPDDAVDLHGGQGVGRYHAHRRLSRRCDLDLGRRCCGRCGRAAVARCGKGAGNDGDREQRTQPTVPSRPSDGAHHTRVAVMLSMVTTIGGLAAVVDR
jgi:hypothetical protein